MMETSNKLIRVSYGTAIVLGLVKARQDVPPTTAYLLWDTGCVGACSFCPRANGNAKEVKLSRIIWPEFEFSEVIELLTRKPHPFKRVCLQTGFNPSQTSQLIKLAVSLVENDLITSVTLSPSQTELATKLLELGVDHIGVGLDGASEATYSLHKKKDWQEDWPGLLKLLATAKEKIEVHLIFGLGDSEETFCRTVGEIIGAGGKVSLFALTPVNGGSAPEIPDYRRVQAFRYLCEAGKITIKDCKFVNGRLAAILKDQDTLLELLDNGDCFRTSGCGDCNRPYYNERPGQIFFNYPRELTKKEFLEAVEQMGLNQSR